MRLIDADALTEFLKCLLPQRGMWEIEGDTAKDAICETVAEAIEMVKNMETIQPAKAQLSREGTTSDLISRQEAIDEIGKAADELYENIKKGATFPQRQWFDGMAHAQSISEDLPPAQPEYRLDEWCHDCKEYDQEHHCCPRFNRVIRESLKDAQPETKEGHWIDKGDDGDWAWQIDGRGNSWHVWGCSECGKSVFTKSSYCPHCGSKMKGETK